MERVSMAQDLLDRYCREHGIVYFDLASRTTMAPLPVAERYRRLMSLRGAMIAAQAAYDADAYDAAPAAERRYRRFAMLLSACIYWGANGNYEGARGQYGYMRAADNRHAELAELIKAEFGLDLYA